MSKPILYSYFRSSCSWRVRIALAYKGIEYEMKPINLLKLENRGEEFLKVNPMGQVPAFQVDGQTLIQSASILEYLEEVYPSPSLLPKDAITRAKVRAVCECIGSGIQPLQNNSVLQKFEGKAREEWAQTFIENGFKAVEKLLETNAGKYSVGDEVSLADCFLLPQIYNANRFKVDLTLYPVISRVAENLQKLPAFQVSHPHQQTDCPESLKEK